MNTNDIEILVKLFKSHGWSEMQVRVDGTELFLSNDPNASATSGVHPLQAVQPVSVTRPEPLAEAESQIAKPSVAPAQVPEHWYAVIAPNLGTFYRSAKPGTPPLVEIGQDVGPDNELCLLEVMKLFTAVRAGVGGIVRQVCVEDAEMVESGQILFYIEKA